MATLSVLELIIENAIEYGVWQVRLMVNEQRVRSCALMRVMHTAQRMACRSGSAPRWAALSTSSWSRSCRMAPRCQRRVAPAQCHARGRCVGRIHRVLTRRVLAQKSDSAVATPATAEALVESSPKAGKAPAGDASAGADADAAPTVRVTRRAAEAARRAATEAEFEARSAPAESDAARRANLMRLGCVALAAARSAALSPTPCACARLLMAVTMTLHNLPEGFAVRWCPTCVARQRAWDSRACAHSRACVGTQVAFSSFTDFGPFMALAVALHNIPEGLIVAGACLSSKRAVRSR